jgi:colanic acid/amylovoran biosynthesis protein
MNILVTHAYSKENKGDAALLSVLLSDIRRGFENPHITILTLERVKEGETFEGAPIKKAFMNYARSRYSNPLLQTMYALFVAASTLLWALAWRIFRVSIPLPAHLKGIALLYRDADLILPVGGGYILSSPGFINTVRLFFVIHPLIFSHILGKPTVNYTQSIGAFGNPLQVAMAKFALKRVAGILVRERISLELLREWGITDHVYLSVDSGFSFESDVKKDVRAILGVPKEKMLIGVTVRKCLEEPAQTSYERAVASFCDFAIRAHHAAVVFIPQVTHDDHKDDDRESSRRVYELMEEKEGAYLLNDRFEHHTIKAMYAGLDYLVGTRFHSVIFALVSCVPAIAIEYQYKTRGIMADLELSDWVLNTRTISAQELCSLFGRLVVERQVYRAHLSEVLPPYIERSKQSIFLAKEAYEDFISQHHDR